MKRLVSLSHLEERQYGELVELLRSNQLRFRESPGGVFTSGAIMVADEDLAAAKEILRRHSEAFAKDARARWEEEWQGQYGGSAARWFAARLRGDPLGVILRLVLLVLAIGAFLLFPIWYVMQGGN